MIVPRSVPSTKRIGSEGPISCLALSCRQAHLCCICTQKQNFPLALFEAGKALRAMEPYTR